MPRKRRQLRPKPFLFLALAANLLAGVFASGLTAPVRVTVEGARPYDRTRLQAIAEGLKGRPYLQIGREAVESAALRNAAVRSARFEGNVFGRCRLLIGYREPVARIVVGAKEAATTLALSDEGVVYPEPDPPRDLPKLRLPASALAANVTFGAAWAPGRMVEVIRRARELDRGDSLVVWLGEDGRVGFNMSLGRVTLGSCDDLDAKFGVLRERLARNPRELSYVRELNLTVPGHPTIVPRANPIDGSTVKDKESRP